MLVEFYVRLCDRVPLRLPCRLVEGERLIKSRPLAGTLATAILLVDDFLLYLLAYTSTLWIQWDKREKIRGWLASLDRWT